MNSLDLSDINPLRWNEVRRRISILEEFSDVKKRNPEVWKTYASKLNLSYHSFYRLYKAWETTNSPKSLRPGNKPGRP